MSDLNIRKLIKSNKNIGKQEKLGRKSGRPRTPSPWISHPLLRRSHNPEVAASNPAPAATPFPLFPLIQGDFSPFLAFNPEP